MNNKKKNPALRIRDWWWRRQRNLDLNHLWPQLIQTARKAVYDHPDVYFDPMDMARGAFWIHAANDPAWINHYGPKRLAKFIAHLE